MKEGVLIFDPQLDRMDIRFGQNDFYGGLNCGDCFDAYINNEWLSTRIEKGNDWYLVGIDRKIELLGLKVRT